jgi:hypothetical protein
MSEELVIKKEGSYGLVEQFRKMARRIILTDLVLSSVNTGEKTVWQFSLRNPWYTSVPVSTVTSINLTINGYEIDEHNVEFVIRDQAIPFSYARNLHELVWGLGECVYIRIIDPKLAEVVQNKNKVTFDLLMRTAFEGYHLPNNCIDYAFEVEMEMKE